MPYLTLAFKALHYRTIVSGFKANAINDELGVRELADAEMYQKSRGHDAGEVKLSGNCGKKPCGISNDGPSCQSSSGIIHNGFEDGPECEPIAIIGMGTLTTKPHRQEMLTFHVGCRLPGGASPPSKL